LGGGDPKAPSNDDGGPKVGPNSDGERLGDPVEDRVGDGDEGFIDSGIETVPDD
jgi:hypothetical protein